MSLRHYAKILGRRGGIKRARSLSSQRRKAIASSGGYARSESLKVVKRIEENFLYLEAVRQMTSSK